MTFQKDAEELKTENRHIPNLENDDSRTIYQTVYHKRIITAINVCVSALPVLH